MKYVDFHKTGKVLIAKLNRPKALNALNSDLMNQLIDTLAEKDNDNEIGCIIITGSEKVFAAGADIKEMYQKSYAEMSREDYFSKWESFSAIRTPKIAAVSGFALGGGCELAMMCDFIYASESAVFGQPEIKLGVIPAIGGTQRLTRMIGKSKAMEMVLTGKFISATEAEKIGLVAQVFSDKDLMFETIKTAQLIADYSKPVAIMAKQMVNNAEELSLKQGIQLERRAFHALFATKDQKEGMNAFLEKRTPAFFGE